MESRELGLAAGLLAIVAAGGCASLTEPSRGVVPTASSSSVDSISSLGGVWEGQVWEKRPSSTARPPRWSIWSAFANAHRNRRARQ